MLHITINADQKRVLNEALAANVGNVLFGTNPENNQPSTEIKPGFVSFKPAYIQDTLLCLDIYAKDITKNAGDRRNARVLMREFGIRKRPE